MIATIFISFVVLLILKVPVSFSLAVSSLITLTFASTIQPTIIVQRLYAAADSFSLLAVPFFILAGGFMETGGISRRLVRFASALVGHIRGGLAMTSVVGAMFFAGISGSTAADTAAIGSVLIPAMERKGYGKDLATSVMASAGAIGIIIPPSIPMVLLGISGNISIGGLFLGGFIPGILMGLGLMVTSYIFARKRNLPAETRSSLQEIWDAFKDSILALMTMVIIVGGMLGGVFTATEASVVAAAYAFCVGFFVYKELSLKDLPEIMVKSAVMTGVVVLCVAAASVFGWILAAERVPGKIAEAIFSFSQNKFVVLALINTMMLLMGTFLDIAPIIIIVVPIVMPIVLELGVSPIHFGLMTIVNMAIGQCTPPVGISLFVSTGISQASLGEILSTFSKYLMTMVLVLLLITAVPELTTFIPWTVMGIK